MGGTALRKHVILWVALAILSVVVIAIPTLPVAWYSPALAVAVATVAGVVGLAVLQFSIFRYAVFGYFPDLMFGLALGTLAVANLALRVVWPAAETILPFDAALYLVLFSRACAAALLLLGLVRRNTDRAPASRTATTWRWGAVVALVGGLGAAAIVRWGGALPSLVGEPGQAIVTAAMPVSDVLPGQHIVLTLVDGAVALAMLAAAVGYVGLSIRHDNPHLTWIAVALTLLVFSQFHNFLFPPVAASYVSTSDAFRLAAYVTLLYSLLRRIGREIEDRALGEERLRLSRELHDGLAQQLGLLHLRLGSAAGARTPETRERDLEAARRLVEAALLEARQVITTLRTEVVTWEELVRAVGTFSDEFAQNHEVDVRFALSGEAPDTLVGAGIEAELLRIAHEALSNAIRHGAASTIRLTLGIVGAGVQLRIVDDGRGFDPATLSLARTTGRSMGLTSGGLGLRSMRERVERGGGTLLLDGAPGRGVSVQVWLPLDPTARPPSPARQDDGSTKEKTRDGT